ncbi:hypothetical protein N7486_008724 [Penicillium sp. IBT 16267x]|nr:hypothetical protein N7486_008724 [Penicillium sp. IBT 16267x]
MPRLLVSTSQYKAYEIPTRTPTTPRGIKLHQCPVLRKRYAIAALNMPQPMHDGNHRLRRTLLVDCLEHLE